MSDGGSEQDKSELPSSYKLKKARERGAVARGMDLGYLTGLAVFCAYAWFQGNTMIGVVRQASRDALVTGPQVLGDPDQLLRLTGLILTSAVRPVAFLTAAIFVAVLVMEIVQTGFVFSTQPLSPDFGRLNPAQGFKRVFSVRALVETFKTVLKVAAYAAIGAFVVRYVLTEVTGAVASAQSLATALQKVGFRLLIFILLASAAFAVLDQFLSRRDFTKRMRMSRREVKREHRDREGDPRMKQRRRQLHTEFVKASESLRNVRGADVLIVNPIHYAVGLKYDSRTMTAPKVVSRGTHQFALRLKRNAFLYGVVIVENPPLARALYSLPMDAEVPEGLFKPVADIYLSIRETKQKDATARSHVS